MWAQISSFFYFIFLHLFSWHASDKYKTMKINQLSSAINYTGMDCTLAEFEARGLSADLDQSWTTIGPPSETWKWTWLSRSATSEEEAWRYPENFPE